MKIRLNFARLCAVCVLSFAGIEGAPARDYSTKAVHVIVGDPAGQLTDIVSVRLGQHIIENRPGAGNNIGTEQATRAAPDMPCCWWFGIGIPKGTPDRREAK